MGNGKIGITIKREQYKWLKTNPMINISGLVAQIVTEEQRKPNPFLVSKKFYDERTCIGITVTLPPEHKKFLDKLRAQNPNKISLSSYVQWRLDYIIKTGQINAPHVQVLTM